jgi:hypothetical protein
MKVKIIAALSLLYVLTPLSNAQEMKYGWVRANGQTYLFNPGDYKAPHSYRPGDYGGNIQVDVSAQRPVTLAIAQESEWARVSENPTLIPGIQYWCMQEHIVATTYTCDLPPSEIPMVLVIHDERLLTGTVVDGVGRIWKGAHTAAALAASNNVQMTYYKWACTENCFSPEFRWSRVAKEKYEVTSIMKVYGLAAPEFDGEQLNVKIKSQVPLLLAVVPSNIANQLYAKPEMLQNTVANSQCQQRGVQTMTFGCSFKVADGPQSLIVLPEQAASLPKHKKAEIELQASRCVAYCVMPALSKNTVQ